MAEGGFEFGEDFAKAMHEECFGAPTFDQNVSQEIVDARDQPPSLRSMKDFLDESAIFMIAPFEYDRRNPGQRPDPVNTKSPIEDRWDRDHVRMPYSRLNVTKKKQPMWTIICHALTTLKNLCDRKIATTEDLRKAIRTCTGTDHDLTCLRGLIDQHYSNQERAHFMSIVLSNICTLALNVESICSRSVPLLRIATNRSVTMSQHQAAALLACAFFCLFPNRSNKEFENFQDPNFATLYRNGPKEKVEKLKCILHYFQRVTDKMPSGVITFQRFGMRKRACPQWNNSKKHLSDLRLTSDEMIEDVKNVLQVDFANKYIGGGVLGNGCVQEEIRFSIYPEMLVSLLVCEVMNDNECVFLIGCERYSNYKGYAQSFQFVGDHQDNTYKDSWGRKWSHLVAIDAIFFQDKSKQYQVNEINRELYKAFLGFFPIGNTPEYHYGIATGNWGCGVFNGDKQLKAIIQLIAASETRRSLTYAAYRDKDLVRSFTNVYQYLKSVNATVADLYLYLCEYSRIYKHSSLFEFILKTPVSTIRQ